MARHRVAVLLLEQVLPLDFAIPMHVLAREAPEFYDVTPATSTGRPVSVAGGLRVVPDGDLAVLRDAQTVIVPGYAGAATMKLNPRRSRRSPPSRPAERGRCRSARAPSRWPRRAC
jgi:putative intracellular protease/amidase